MNRQRQITALLVELLIVLGVAGCAVTPSKSEWAFYYKKGSTREQYEQLDRIAREFAIRKTRENRSTDLNSLDRDDRITALLIAESFRDAYFRQEGWKRVTPEYAERRWEKEKKSNSAH